MEAMGARFRSQGVHDREIQEEIKRKTERACQMVMMRLASGTVELSTMQTLCILSMLEFTGKTAVDLIIGFHSNIGSSLTQRVISSAPGLIPDLLLTSCEISG